ncbi:MAG: T9SS type A sorting domain-containing protein [Chitinophagaceae bacterium]
MKTIRLFLAATLVIVCGNVIAQNPGGVSGATLWLKANAGTSASTQGAPVASWTNQGITPASITAATSQQPFFQTGGAANGINYNPTLLFDGADDYFATDNAFSTDNSNLFTIISVDKRRTNNYQSLLIAAHYYQITAAFNYGFNPSGQTYVSASNNSDVKALITNPINTAELLGVNRSTDHLFQFYNKGAADGPINTMSNFTGPFNPDIMNIGPGFNGDFAEEIVFNSSLSAADMQKVHSYLALKYGISLDQTTATDYLASNGVTKIWSNSFAGGYNNNIFGIGRDDNSQLLQKISASQNTRGIVTLALQNDFTSANNAAARTTSFTADNSFITVSDNSAATGNPAWTNSQAPAGKFILNSQWQVQTNAAAQPVFLQFDVANSNYDVPALATGSSYYLVYDNSGTISLSSQVVQLVNTSGSLWSLPSAISFPNGTKFTLASMAPSPGGAIGATLWLKANAGTSTSTQGTPVASWANQGMTTASITAATSQQPLFQTGDAANGVNYNPALRFDGIDDIFLANSIFSTNDQNLFTIITVQKRKANNGWASLFQAKHTEFTYTAALAYGFDPSGYPNIGAANNGAVQGTSISPLNTADLLSVNRSLPGTFQLLSKGGNNVGPAIMSNFSGWFLNEDSTSIGNGYNGDLSEEIVFNSSLSAADMQKVHSYLALKYGISLDQTTATNYLASDGSTKMWNATTAGIFNNRIFGIGTDNGSDLKQQISTEQTTTDATAGLLTIATVNDFTTANTLRSAPLANLNFVTVSDNGGPISATTTNKPAGMVSILARSWKLQTNSPAASIYLQFNAANSTTGSFPALAAGQSYMLIYTTNALPDYTANTTTVQLTKNGNLLTTAAGVTMPAGAIFTVAISPATLAGTAPGLWLKADAGITLATSAGPWVDQSVNAYNMPIVNPGIGGPNGLSNTINFNPSLTFNSENAAAPNVLGYSAFPISSLMNTGISQFIVYKSGPPNVSLVKINYGANDYAYGGPFAVAYSPQVGFWFNNAISGIPGGVAANTPGTTYMAGMVTSGSGGTVSINGVTGAAAGNGGNNSGSDLYIGTIRNSQGSPYRGTTDAISEIIIFPSDQTVNRNKIESYLATKYGITLPVDYVSTNAGIYYNVTTSTPQNNSGFTKDITGIGKESTQGLDQEQSYSQSASLPVYVGAGGLIASSNIGRTSSLADNSYLAFGNDGGAVNFATAVTGQGAFNKRMARTWKLQLTGTNPGTVMIAIPVSAFPLYDSLGGTICQPVALLTGNSAGFASGTSNIINSGTQNINGTPCYTFALNPINGNYFTFAAATPGNTPTLVATGTVSPGTVAANSCNSLDGFTAYVDLAAPINKYLSIQQNSNPLPTLTVTQDASGTLPYVKDDLVNCTVIANRLYNIKGGTEGPGAPTYPNPMKVRIYYTDADLANADAALPHHNGIHDAKWFQYEGSIAQTLAAQMPDSRAFMGTTGINFSFPIPTYGVENGVKYVEFSNIKKFSTFGYMVGQTEFLLPVGLHEFKGNRQGTNNLLQWKVEDGVNINGFQLQRSTTGNGGFATIARPAYANGQINYSYTDAGITANQYYRLAMQNADGSISYSNVVYIAANGAVQSMRVSPNPAIAGSAFNISLTGYTGIVTAHLYDFSGKLISNSKFANGNNILSSAKLAKGIYQLVVTDANGNARTEKLVVQ